MVLGRDTMWACFNPLTSSPVPQDIGGMVKSQYICICTPEHTLNPIRKVGLVVCGHEGKLSIDNLVVDDKDEAACSNDETSRTTIILMLLLSIRRDKDRVLSCRP